MSGFCSGAFERLAQAVSQVDPLPSSEDTLTCVEAQDALDIVVTDEIGGIDVDQRHQDVLTHLVRCQECRLVYSLLREMLLADEGAGKPGQAAAGQAGR